MNFQKNPIKTQNHSLDKAEHWIRGHLFLSFIALALGAFVLKGVVGAIQSGNPFSVTQIVLSAISEGVEMDTDRHTNILLLGVGGEGHDGENLTDTMIVASIDHKEKLIPMLSIPRDLFVDSEALGYGTRINGIYELMLDKTNDPTLAMNALIEEVEKITAVEIHYYAKVDFSGFEEVVDAVGGVEVNVIEDIYDATYPAPDGSAQDFEPFYLEAGIQELDGETTLKYVRSRHSTSDFDRARRQQEVINALKDKATSLGILLNPGKLKNLYTAVSSNFETNLNWSEMLYLAKLGDQFGTESIHTAVLNDGAYQMGGFLYTPDRELYGGAFVLVPYSGDFGEIQTFADLFLYHPELYSTPTPLQILNGTKEIGLAAMTKMYLERYGFTVVRHGNGLDRELAETNLFWNRELTEVDEATIELLPSLLGSGEILEETPSQYSLESFPTEATVIIELGDDFLEYYNENGELFYVGVY
ncbi:MAG: LCP family protein [Patescibacteria group bacterium]